MDIRDRWMGLRKQRSNFRPLPYCSVNETGKHIPRSQRAQEAAKFWSEQVWTDMRSIEDREYHLDYLRQKPNIMYRPFPMDEGDITMTELKAAVKKLKRRKSPGPDSLPIELVKELFDDSLEVILGILNKFMVAGGTGTG